MDGSLLGSLPRSSSIVSIWGGCRWLEWVLMTLRVTYAWNTRAQGVAVCGSARIAHTFVARRAASLKISFSAFAAQAAAAASAFLPWEASPRRRRNDESRPCFLACLLASVVARLGKNEKTNLMAGAPAKSNMAARVASFNARLDWPCVAFRMQRVLFRFSFSSFFFIFLFFCFFLFG